MWTSIDIDNLLLSVCTRIVWRKIDFISYIIVKYMMMITRCKSERESLKSITFSKNENKKKVLTWRVKISRRLNILEYNEILIYFFAI
jgi:hypothetical protein